MGKLAPLFGRDVEQLCAGHHHVGGVDASSFLSGQADKCDFFLSPSDASGVPVNKKVNSIGADLLAQSQSIRHSDRRHRFNSFLPSSFSESCLEIMKKPKFHGHEVNIVDNCRLGVELTKDTHTADACNKSAVVNIVGSELDAKGPSQALTFCKLVDVGDVPTAGEDADGKSCHSWGVWKCKPSTKAFCENRGAKCTLPASVDGLRWQVEQLKAAAAATDLPPKEKAKLTKLVDTDHVNFAITCKGEGCNGTVTSAYPFAGSAEPATGSKGAEGTHQPPAEEVVEADTGKKDDH